MWDAHRRVLSVCRPASGPVRSSGNYEPLVCLFVLVAHAQTFGGATTSVAGCLYAMHITAAGWTQQCIDRGREVEREAAKGHNWFSRIQANIVDILLILFDVVRYCLILFSVILWYCDIEQEQYFCRHIVLMVAHRRCAVVCWVSGPQIEEVSLEGFVRVTLWWLASQWLDGHERRQSVSCSPLPIEWPETN